MDKEELLHRARSSKENQKNGVEQQQVLEGARYGAMVFCILVVVLLIYTFLKGRFMESRLILAILWLFLPASMYGMSRLADKKDKPTGTMVVCFLVGVGFLISYFMKSW